MNRRPAQERSVEIRLCSVRLVAQSMSKCFHVNFSFFRKFKRYWDFILLLRITEVTLESLLDLLCVWIFQLSQILHFLIFIPGLQEKHFSTCCFQNISGTIVSFPIHVSNSSVTWNCSFHTAAGIN